MAILFMFSRNGLLAAAPLNTEAVEIKVTTDGVLEEVDRYPVYRDPSEDNMCVD